MMTMMTWINDFQASFNDPQTRHAMVVHLPIALSMLGVLAVLACLLSAGRNATLRWVAVAVYALMVVGLFAALNSGEAAENNLQRQMLPAAQQHLEEHEKMADKTWWIAGSVLVLLLVSNLKHKTARIGSLCLALLVSLFGSLWVGRTAHHGGAMVYQFGVGTPMTAASTPPAPPLRAPPGSAASVETLPAQTADPALAFFREQVLPELATHCFNCHNDRRAKGGLRQTSRESILKGGDTGPAVVVGRPDESLLMRALSYEDIELQMPPKERLPDDVIAKFERWIRDGLAWDEEAVTAKLTPRPQETQ